MERFTHSVFRNSTLTVYWFTNMSEIYSKPLPENTGPGLNLNVKNMFLSTDIELNQNSHFVVETYISARVLSGNVSFNNTVYAANTGFKLGVNGYISSEETANVRLFYFDTAQR